MLQKMIVGTMLMVSVLYVNVYAGDTYPYRNSCPQDQGIDKWSFYKCNCTSYVAHKLNEDGIPFSNAYKGVQWSNGGNWGVAAEQAGLTVNMSPQVGDAVFWTAANIGNVGHIAYVEGVNGDGTIEVSEYNWKEDFQYYERTEDINDVSGFIHFLKPNTKKDFFYILEPPRQFTGEETYTIAWYPNDVTCHNAEMWAENNAIHKDSDNSVCDRAYQILCERNWDYFQQEWRNLFFGEGELSTAGLTCQ